MLSHDGSDIILAQPKELLPNRSDRGFLKADQSARIIEVDQLDQEAQEAAEKAEKEAEYARSVQRRAFKIQLPTGSKKTLKMNKTLMPASPSRNAQNFQIQMERDLEGFETLANVGSEVQFVQEDLNP